MALNLLEQLIQQTYQCCLIDPEGDYETFREVIKDTELAKEAEAIEKQPFLTAAESRASIRAAIDKRYTLPS